ncbi:MAG: DNA polymerase III subunit gamma/tau [Cellvibrionales bacterium]|nr:DNA polymerase III subunit gamma/tau [Cellvibrionales bacterium]
MSYQVLARKYRPRFFREMVGQQHVLQALINALETGRLHHAYLFSGTRGVGKTSIARILAKCLSCEQGVSATPCGECTACTEISGGHFVDLIEVDAASRTRVEDTRELLDNVQYAPTKGRFKIYLVDEVHMLSTHSFNALLKTLEEPPSHVKFLLATTDPQKLPPTILSRCLQFTLKNLSAEFITGHLQQLLTTESVDFEEQALWSLGHAADGSMRDALSLTDQAIAFCQNHITQEAVGQMLGTIDPQVVRQVIEALINHDGASILSIVSEVAEFSPNYSQMLDEVLMALHRLTIAQQVPEAIDNQYGDQAFILEQAKRLSPEELQLFYQMALLGKKDFALAPSPRSGFEMTLLRLLAFRPLGMSEPERLDDPSPQVDSDASGQVQAQRDDNVPSSDAAGLESSSPASSKPQAVLENKRELSMPDPMAPPAEAEAENLPVQDSSRTKAIVAELEESLEVLSSPVDEAISDKLSACDNTDAPLEAPVVNSQRNVTQASEASDTPSLQKEEPCEILPSPEVITVAGTSGEAANQQWLDCYDALPLQGLLGSIAAHMVVESTEGDKWSAKIDPTQSQLLNENHIKQIEQALSGHLSYSVRLSLDVSEHALLTPDQRKQHIKAQESENALSFLKESAPLQSILVDYDAQIDNNTVELIRR